MFPALKELIALNRDLKLIFLSNLLWNCGTMLYWFIWPLYVRELGGSAREIGFLYSLMFLTITISYIPGGILADRLDRKKLILACWIICTPAPLIYAFATHWHHLIPGIIIYCLWFGVPALDAYTAASAPEGKMTRAFTLTNAGYSLGMIFGPLAGGYLLTITNIRWLFKIAFGFFVLSTMALFFLSSQKPSKSATPSSALQAAKVLLKNKRLMAWVLLFAFISFSVFMASPFISPFLEDRYSLSRPVILVFGSLLALGQVGIAVILGWIGDRWRSSAALAICLMLIAVGLVILVSQVALPLVPVAMLLLGGNMVSGSLRKSIIGKTVGEATGSAFALYLILVGIMEMCGPAVGGMLYEHSPSFPFITAAASMLIISSLVFWKMHAI